jgi:hypothetical protein
MRFPKERDHLMDQSRDFHSRNVLQSEMVGTLFSSFRPFIRNPVIDSEVARVTTSACGDASSPCPAWLLDISGVLMRAQTLD